MPDLQDAPESLKVRVAPLTVTANPKQALYAAPTLLFHWYREPWSDIGLCSRGR